MSVRYVLVILVHNLLGHFFCQVAEATQIGAQAIKENSISVEEVHDHLQVFDENITVQKRVNEALGNVFFILQNLFPPLLFGSIIHIILLEVNSRTPPFIFSVCSNFKI